MKKDFKDFESVFSSILDTNRDEARTNTLFEWVVGQARCLGNPDPDELYTIIVFRLNNIISECVQVLLKSDDWLIQTIYTDYGMIENNVTGLCQELFGCPFSADRGRHIIRCAVKWRLTNKLPVFAPEKKGNYHHPKTGTPEQWMSFVEGIGSLRYGYPVKYLSAYKDLICSKCGSGV